MPGITHLKGEKETIWNSNTDTNWFWTFVMSSIAQE